MKQKFTRRATAILLALLLACAACMPAIAASKQASGTTLGDLIQIDEKLLQESYSTALSNFKASGKYGEEQSQAIAIGLMLYVEANLVDQGVQTVYDHVVNELLRQQKMPNSLEEDLVISRQMVDETLVKQLIKNTLPKRHAVISEPNDAVTKELNANGGKPKDHETDTWQYVCTNTNLEWYGYGKEHGQTRLEALIGAVKMDSEGWATVVFQLHNASKKEIKLDFFQEVELPSPADSSKYFAGGTSKDKEGYFSVPIDLQPGEFAIVSVDFAPKTWYDLNPADLAKNPGTSNVTPLYHIAITAPIK